MPPLAWLVGLAAWAAVLIVLPAPTAARVFLAAPLLIVPLLLGRLPGRVVAGRLHTGLLRAAWCLPAGLLVALALALPSGPMAAVAALPWVGLTTLVGLAALRHGAPRLVTLFGPSRTADLATDGAFGFLAVGGLFLLVDRLGIAVFGSGPPSTLLGAIHYHFAGFGLLGLLALMAGGGGAAAGGADAMASRWHWLAALGLIGGVSVTAVGLAVESALVNWLGVVLLGGGGFIVARSLVSAAGRGWRRLALVLAAAALALGLVMGLAWASAVLFELPFLGMEQMVRSHGALNAAAVVLGALALGLPNLRGEPR